MLQTIQHVASKTKFSNKMNFVTSNHCETIVSTHPSKSNNKASWNRNHGRNGQQIASVIFVFVRDDEILRSWEFPWFSSFLRNCKASCGKFAYSLLWLILWTEEVCLLLYISYLTYAKKVSNDFIIYTPFSMLCNDETISTTSYNLKISRK